MDRHIQTYTGKYIDVINPRPQDIYHVDIAHALSFAPRFGGHTRELYTVGEHSIIMCHLFLLQGELILAKDALFHDSSEAYVLDMPRPIKYMPEMAAYKTLEKNLQGAIYEKYGLGSERPEVKAMDTLLVQNEARDLMVDSSWATEFIPNLKVTPFGNPKITEENFLRLYDILFNDNLQTYYVPAIIGA